MTPASSWGGGYDARPRPRCRRPAARSGADRRGHQGAAATVPDAVDPLDDFRGSADYKREMAGVFTRRALTQALSTIPSAIEKG